MPIVTSATLASQVGGIQALRRVLRGRRRILLLAHDHPDPDALATAAALKLLLARPGVSITVGYAGVLGRAENREMVRLLEIQAVPIQEWQAQEFDACVLVDTQPGFGNNSLPARWSSVAQLAGGGNGGRATRAQPRGVRLAVVDHHPVKGDLPAEVYRDIRPSYGATATIATEYLREAGIEPDVRLATALFYAVKTETQGLARAASPADVEAYLYLEPRADRPLLSRIEHAPVPAQYFAVMARALRAARCYGDAVVCNAGELHQPDMLGELADLLMRLEGIATCLVIGFYDGALLLSIRTRDEARDAGHLARTVVEGLGTGGGHPCMGGGQLRDAPREPVARRALFTLLSDRFLNAQGLGEIPGRPLGRP